MIEKKGRIPIGDDLCGGDHIEGVADLFRILKRAGEYLIEADRQIRGGGTAEEQQASALWYADMDGNNEWTGFTAEAHVACAEDIVLFFDEHPELVLAHDNRPFFIDGAWQKLKIKKCVAQLRNDIKAMLLRLANQSTSH